MCQVSNLQRITTRLCSLFFLLVYFGSLFTKINQWLQLLKGQFNTKMKNTHFSSHLWCCSTSRLFKCNKLCCPDFCKDTLLSSCSNAFYLFIFFCTLSTTSHLGTLYWWESRYLSNSHTNHLDGYMSLQVRGNICILDFKGWTVPLNRN